MCNKQQTVTQYWTSIRKTSRVFTEWIIVIKFPALYVTANLPWLVIESEEGRCYCVLWHGNNLVANLITFCFGAVYLYSLSTRWFISLFKGLDEDWQAADSYFTNLYSMYTRARLYCKQSSARCWFNVTLSALHVTLFKFLNFYGVVQMGMSFHQFWRMESQPRSVNVKRAVVTFDRHPNWPLSTVTYVYTWQAQSGSAIYWKHRHLRIERVCLPLCKVADTLFQPQDDDFNLR